MAITDSRGRKMVKAMQFNPLNTSFQPLYAFYESQTLNPNADPAIG